MTGYSYSISLRVTHPQRTPESITAALGMEPKRSWLAGAPRTTPKGRPLQGVYKETYWIVRLVDGDWPDQSLPTAINLALDGLAHNQGWFVDLAEDGGSSEFFIGWYFENGNSGDEIDYRLLARLAEFRMNLSFDIYPELQYHS